MAQKGRLKTPALVTVKENFVNNASFLRRNLNVILIQRTISRTIRERYQCSIHILYYLWEWYYIYPKFKTVLKVHTKILLRCEMG